MDSKLKCVFVMPENSSNSGGAGGAVSNGAEKSSEKPDSHNSIPSSVPTKPSSPKVIFYTLLVLLLDSMYVATVWITEFVQVETPSGWKPQAGFPPEKESVGFSV